MPESSPISPAAEPAASSSAPGGKRRKVVKVDHAAARILKRLDQLEQRLEQQAPPAPAADEASDQRWNDLQQAIHDQQNAIACIANAVTGLQTSLTEQISATVAESLRQQSTIDTSGREQPPAEERLPTDDQTPADMSGDAQPFSDNDQPAESKAAPEPVNAGDRWAQIRAAFLAGDADESATQNSDGIRSEAESDEAKSAATEAAEAAAAARDAAQKKESAEERDAEQTLALLNSIPTLVDAARVPESELRSVLIDRDRFIALLTGRLQSSLRKSQPLTNQQMKEISEMAPEELQRKIDQTLNALDSQVRLGELELSLERARIGRQASTLECTREKLAAAARAVGLTLNEDGTLNGAAEATVKGSRGRNWLGAMGFGN